MYAPRSLHVQLSRSALATLSLCLCSLSLTSLSLTAQCQLGWQPGEAASGPAGSVRALARPPNGDLVAGGSFAVADHAVAANIARFDGAAWHALGSGLVGAAYAMVVLPNGDLVVGGSISSAGGNPVSNVARWDGANWSAFGSGLPGQVLDLAALPNGDLVAAGDFVSVGGQANVNVARWNGTSWSAIGAGTGLYVANALLVMPNGDLLAGGEAPTGVPDVQRWNGTTWAGLPGLASNALAGVWDLALMPNGDLAIAAFVYGVGPLAFWNGTQLLPTAPPIDEIRALAITRNGDLVASGFGQAGIARFAGGTWTGIGVGAPHNALALLADAGNGVFAGGSVVGSPTSGTPVAHFDGSSWTALGQPPAPTMKAVQRLGNGDIVVGGAFSQLGGVAVHNIARWNGSGWSPLGSGVDGTVTSLALAADGSLLVAGDFLTAGGAPAQRVARWNGSAWSTIGAGLPAAAVSLAANPVGEMLAITPPPPASSAQGLWRFDGLGWSTVTPPAGGSLVALQSLPNGEIALVGTFLEFQPFQLRSVYRYSGGTFQADPGSIDLAGMAAGVSEAGQLLVAASIYGSANSGGVYRIAGGAALPIVTMSFNGSVRAFDFLPNGDLILGGPLSAVNGQPVDRIARWDGAAWSQVDGGVQSGSVNDLAVSGAGELFVTGDFVAANHNVSVALARAATNCPASVQSFGAGCTGGAGPVTLAAHGLPWSGGTFSSTASGMAPQSLAIHAVGLHATVSPLPLGAAGCSLFVDPVFLDLLVPNAGSAVAAFFVPNAPALQGQIVRTQVIGIELDPSLMITRTTGTNALHLTIGAL